jgi:hypothetical protein
MSYTKQLKAQNVGREQPVPANSVYGLPPNAKAVSKKVG